MYCPQCRGEFVENITHCPTCDIDLVHELPELSLSEKRSRLMFASQFAIYGAMAIFAVFALSTFVPVLFQYTIGQLLWPAVHAIGYGTYFMFFIRFYSEYTGDKPDVIEVTTTLTIVSAGAMCLINIWLFIRRFAISVIGSFDPRMHWSSDWLLLIAAAASLIYVIFFAALYRTSDDEPEVKTASRLAFFGSAIWFISFCLGVIRTHVMTPGSIPLYLEYARVGLALLASAIWAITMANFFAKFQKVPKQDPLHELIGTPS